MIALNVPKNNCKIMNTYTVSFLGRSMFDEDELIEKFPKFKTLSKKKKDEKVFELFYKIIGTLPCTTDVELYDEEIEIDDDGEEYVD